MTEKNENVIKRKSKQHPLTPAQWEEIVELWETGRATLAMLAAKYDVSITAVHLGLKSRGAVKASRISQEIENIRENSKKDSEKVFKEIAEIKDRYKKYTDFVGQTLIKRMVATQKGDKSLAIIGPEVTVLKNASITLKNVREELWALYNLDKDDEVDKELPELNIGVMSEEDEEAIREMQADALKFQEDDDDDFGI